MYETKRRLPVLPTRQPPIHPTQERTIAIIHQLQPARPARLPTAPNHTEQTI